jgi:hypothetical protein
MRRSQAVGLALAISLTPSFLSAQIYTRRNTNGVIEATNVPSEADFRLTYPGKGTLIHSRGFRKSYFGQYDQDINDAANVHGVSVDLVRAVIGVESEFDAYAVSSKGAQGLMQLMPFTARRFGVNNPFDPRQNIFGGTQYLRFLLDLFAGDVNLAVAAYNAGENAVQRFKGIPPFRETQGYVRKVRTFLRDGVPLSSGGAPTRIALAPPPVAYTPADVAAWNQRRTSKSNAPVRARTYYKYRDGGGVLHVAQTPPAEGVLYTTIRAFD